MYCLFVKPHEAVSRMSFRKRPVQCCQASIFKRKFETLIVVDLKKKVVTVQFNKPYIAQQQIPHTLNWLPLLADRPAHRLIAKFVSLSWCFRGMSSTVVISEDAAGSEKQR